ncbi:hypothetical protein D9599_19415 [Roseomonas sp. KE2513]|uniref:AIPR family protein n=1 Tax=Roseomonas sp. KE2513 TaxID=2479202 RepID=UPI0018DF80DA|nr:AIPR family protein [Roseomonas sp. KE2513]MBI0537734.1 hypothetical protein [Roseomonas sp. KE2513]
MTDHERLEAQINTAFEELKGRYGAVRNDYYGLVYMERMLHVARKDALEQVAFGNADRGIDGVFFDPDTGIFRVLQFKNSRDARQLHGSMRVIAEHGLKSLTDRSTVPDHQQILDTGRRLLAEAGAGLRKVQVQFVFRGNAADATSGGIFSDLAEHIERYSYLFEGLAGREVPVEVQVTSFDGLLPERPSERHRIRIDGRAEITTGSGVRMLVCFVPLVDLAAIFNAMGARFLERNVRFGLGAGGHVNRALSRTLRDLILKQDTDPAAFAIHHNGVTLSAHDLQEGSEHAEIFSPRLLNGAQTISTFSAVCEELRARLMTVPADRLAGIKVLCRIVLAAPQEQVTRITIDTNRQNPVDAWLLHANDPIQVDFELRFRQLRIFYQRQASALATLTEEEREQASITETKPVEMIKLARTYLAAEGQITRLSQIGEVAENGKHYADIFNEQRLDFDFRVLVLCYKMQFRLNKVVNAISETVTTDRYAFVNRSRDLVWGLTCQALLNSKELNQHAEEFGNDLRIRDDYLTLVTGLATGPVKTILRNLANEDEFKRLIKDNSFSFLRKTATFDKAMDIAGQRCGWKRKYLR